MTPPTYKFKPLASLLHLGPTRILRTSLQEYTLILHSAPKLPMPSRQMSKGVQKGSKDERKESMRPAKKQAPSLWERRQYRYCPKRKLHTADSSF